jgi:hypothetical protein
MAWRKTLWKERMKRRWWIWKEKTAEPLEQCQDTWKRCYIQEKQVL